MAKPIPDPNGGSDFKYRPLKMHTYTDPKTGYKCTITLKDYSDGASGAFDKPSLAWWIHDMLCKRGHWDCGTLLSNKEASRVLSDILKSEGRWFRARTWYIATLFGCNAKVVENGRFTLND